MNLRALCSPDWLQTAEELASLDLLVSVDTSVAHLAGALGVPTVLMLNAPCDWRWGQADDQTFLYDAMTLVRCAAPGDWSQALQQADCEVSKWFSYQARSTDQATWLPLNNNMTGMQRYSGEHLGLAPHIVVLGSCKVGNFVVSTPMLRGLRARFPDAVIGFIGSEVTADFEQALPVLGLAL